LNEPTLSPRELCCLFRQGDQGMPISDAGADPSLPGAEKTSTYMSSPHPSRPSGKGWLSALLLVVLVGGVSAIAFTQLAQHRGGGLQGPPTNTWEKVLSGYTISEVVQSSPGVLYACATKGGNAVTSIAVGSDGSYTNPSFTVLRTIDEGATWTDIGARARFAGSCQLATNPAERDEVYVVSDPRTIVSNATEPSFLMHTTDGGQSWSRIDPTVNLSGGQTHVPWWIQDLRMVDGGRLFGLIPVSLPTLLPPGQLPSPQPRSALSLLRLATSQDGGKTWRLMDGQLEAAQLDARSYGVDPANPDTAYLMVGQPVGPIIYQGPPHTPLPAYPPQPAGTNSDLYRTTDGGSSWTRVLADLPFGMTVQVAGSALVYVGGSPSPVPLIATSGGGMAEQTHYGAPAVASNLNEFSLHASRDGGATWQTISPLPVQTFGESWFVAPDGSVYVYVSGFYIGSGSGTAVPGSPGAGGGSSGGKPGQGGSPSVTAIAGTPAAPLPTGGGRQPGMTPQAQTSSPPRTGEAAGALPATDKNLGFRYNPSNAAWGTLAMPQIEGILVAVTKQIPGGGETALWFMDQAAPEGSLYRDLV
jgi:hypothetical protein